MDEETNKPARSPKVLIRANGRMNVCGTRVSESRNKLGLSQSDLCGRLATVTNGEWIGDRRDIYRIEKGTRKIADVELLALALALEVSPLWLLVGNKDERAETGFSSIQ